MTITEKFLADSRRYFAAGASLSPCVIALHPARQAAAGRQAAKPAVPVQPFPGTAIYRVA